MSGGTHEGLKSPRERADEVAESEGLPEDNPFASVVRGQLSAGASWSEIHEKIERVYGVIDKAAFEESMKIVPDWRVAVVKDDPKATSGERYEFYERTAETAEEAEEMVEKATALPVASEKTEQIGTSKVC